MRARPFRSELVEAWWAVLLSLPRKPPPEAEFPALGKTLTHGFDGIGDLPLSENLDGSG